MYSQIWVWQLSEIVYGKTSNLHSTLSQGPKVSKSVRLKQVIQPGDCYSYLQPHSHKGWKWNSWSSPQLGPNSSPQKSKKGVSSQSLQNLEGASLLGTIVSLLNSLLGPASSERFLRFWRFLAASFSRDRHDISLGPHFSVSVCAIHVFNQILRPLTRRYNLEIFACDH